MAGKIKQLLDQIIEARSQGNPMIAQATKTKLILKGISPDRYTEDSVDDPTTMARIHSIAKELELPLPGLF